MHNAGVTNSTSGMFYKAEYMNKLPYNEKLELTDTTTSYLYWQWIEETAKKSVLL